MTFYSEFTLEIWYWPNISHLHSFIDQLENIIFFHMLVFIKTGNPNEIVGCKRFRVLDICTRESINRADTHIGIHFFRNQKYIVLEWGNHDDAWNWLRHFRNPSEAVDLCDVWTYVVSSFVRLSSFNHNSNCMYSIQ